TVRHAVAVFSEPVPDRPGAARIAATGRLDRLPEVVAPDAVACGDDVAGAELRRPGELRMPSECLEGRHERPEFVIGLELLRRDRIAIPEPRDGVAGNPAPAL